MGELSRQEVAHLPVPEAVDKLERELPERMAGHVRAFHSAGYKFAGSSVSPRVRRVLRVLVTEAARLATNGSGTARKSAKALSSIRTRRS